MIATFLLLFVKPLMLGIDFTGGLLFEARFTHTPNITAIREKLSGLHIGHVTIQSLKDSNDVMIKAGVDDARTQAQVVQNIKDVLINKVDSKVEFRKIEFIGAEVGSEMVKDGLIAICLTFVGIMVYVWFRFNLEYAIGAVLGLIHDLILTIGFLAISGYEVNMTTVAAVLTIVGYSVNDIVVIFDRIREKRSLLSSSKSDFVSLLNSSINETLSRTILTVSTVLLASTVLIFYGGEALKSFSVTVFVGVVVGTYSSVFVSVPILNLLHQRLKRS
jgi:preprotein translocase SecF subunit